MKLYMHQVTLVNINHYNLKLSPGFSPYHAYLHNIIAYAPVVEKIHRVSRDEMVAEELWGPDKMEAYDPVRMYYYNSLPPSAG